MRRLHTTIAALAIVAIGLVGCEQEAGEDVGATEEEVAEADTADPEAELEALTTRYEDAWAARDYDAVMVMYTDDFQELTTEGQVRSRDDVEAGIRDTANAPPEDARISIDFETMSVAESGDLAYGTGTTTFTATGPDGQAIEEQERWMAGFEKVDGEWKVDRLVLVGGGATPAAEETGDAM